MADQPPNSAIPITHHRDASGQRRTITQQGESNKERKVAKITGCPPPHNTKRKLPRKSTAAGLQPPPSSSCLESTPKATLYLMVRHRHRPSCQAAQSSGLYYCCVLSWLASTRSHRSKASRNTSKFRQPVRSSRRYRQ